MAEHIVTGQVSSTTPLVIEDLPTGASCEVAEASDARFFTTYEPANAAGDAAAATIATGGNDVGITNSTGAVIVAKETVVSPLHPIDPVDDFSFTIDCGAVYVADHSLTTDLLTPTGATGVIFYTDLPLIPEGTVCDITELDETPEWTLSSDRTVTLTASSASPVTAEFVNTRTLGSLAINKLIEGPDTVDLSAEEFNVTVTCSGGFTEEPYILTGTINEIDTFVIEELPYGAECSVEEAADARFTSTIAEPNATITEEASEIDVLNQTGSFVLDIESLVNSVFPLDPDDDFQFVVIATLPDGTVVETIVDITTLDGNGNWESPLFPTGTLFSVTLEASDEWALIDRNGNAVGDASIELTIGTDVQNIGFQVERALSSLTINKDLANIGGGDFSDHEFDVTVTCSNGFAATDYELPGAFTVTNTTPIVINDLPVGSTCEVVEAADDFFVATYAPASGVTIDNDSLVNAVTITNTGTAALLESLIEPEPLAFTGRTIFTTVWIALLMLAVGVSLLISRRKEEELT